MEEVSDLTEAPVVRVNESFDRFYRREYDRAVRLAYVLSGSRWGAEDLAQDAFADAHRRWDHVSDYEDPGAWVRRAIANRSVSAYRKRMAEGRAIVRMVGGHRPQLPELAADTEHVWRAVRSLPPRQAQAIALTYLEDMSLKEVADALEITVPTAGTHLQRARRSLGEMLQAEVGE